MDEKIKKVMLELGAKDMQKTYDWNGYEVYEAVYDYKGSPVIGYPDYLLVKGDELRMADIDEVFEYMRYQYNIDNKNKTSQELSADLKEEL